LKTHENFAIKVFGIKFRGNPLIVSRGVAYSQMGNGQGDLRWVCCDGESARGLNKSDNLMFVADLRIAVTLYANPLHTGFVPNPAKLHAASVGSGWGQFPLNYS
jgi:hypothetical protein